MGGGRLYIPVQSVTLYTVPVQYRVYAAGMNRERDQPLADAEAAYLRAPPGTRRSAVTDAVGLAPSLLPRPGAVAITVTTTALDRVSGVWRRVRPGVRVWSGA